MEAYYLNEKGHNEHFIPASTQRKQPRQILYWGMVDICFERPGPEF